MQCKQNGGQISTESEMKVNFTFYLKMVSQNPLKKQKNLEWKFLKVGKTTKDKKKHFKYHIFRKKIAININEDLQFCALSWEHFCFYFQSGLQLQRNKTRI